MDSSIYEPMTRELLEAGGIGLRSTVKFAGNAKTNQITEGKTNLKNAKLKTTNQIVEGNTKVNNTHQIVKGNPKVNNTHQNLKNGNNINKNLENNASSDVKNPNEKNANNTNQNLENNASSEVQNTNGKNANQNLKNANETLGDKPNIEENGKITADNVSNKLSDIIKNPLNLFSNGNDINVKKELIDAKELIDFKSTPISTLISSSLFILYTFLDLMDMNNRVLNYNILTASSTTQSSMVFAYLNSYYIMILKIIINLLTIYVLLSIVAIVLVTVSDIFLVNHNEVTISKQKVIAILKTLSTYTLGFIIADSNMPKWIFIFLILIPILLVFSILGTSRFYNQETVLINTKNTANIMQTFHDTNMFIVVLLISAGILYILFTYKWT